MTKYQQLAQLIQTSQKLVLAQANNPDGDSLASALALEELLADRFESVQLYCASLMPDYLRYLDGYDRVLDFYPGSADLVILVDSGSADLLDSSSGLTLKPADLAGAKLVVLDHHPTQVTIAWAELVINEPDQVATGALIYKIARELNWSINSRSADFLAASILSDTLGLTSQVLKANPQPVRVLADLIEAGADLPRLNQRRLEAAALSPEIMTYKGQLLGRIDYLADGQLAVLVVDHNEIKQLAGRYNPTVVLDDLRLVAGCRLTLGFKKYFNGPGQLVRVTLRIRAFGAAGLAGRLAEQFGGGGHSFAAGAKWLGDDLDFDQIKADVCQAATSLLTADQNSAAQT